ncbi:beta-1 adrenergic receptor [Exaiptasia diaphana]|uniref:G-protein coupled receptors family 1 profile domain-containing protein n=1 Tax=Exaiptasia diaphana TaxID=2652724 RepID=A0A913X2N1_EXADI|nr:beta-1 adrenergic receptor [Exaiptasia diaphana]
MDFNNSSAVNSTTHEPSWHASPSVFLANGIFLAIISPLTIILNTLLLFAIYKDPFKTFQTPSAFFLVGLSTTDLVLGLMLPFPMSCYFIAYDGDSSQTNKCFKILMDYIGILVNSSINSSFLIVLAFTVVQYLAVSWPFRYKNLVNIKRTICCIVAIWTYTIIFQLTETFGVQKIIISQIDVTLHTTIAFIVMVTVYILLQRSFKKKIKKGLRLRAETSTQSTMCTLEGSPKATAHKTNPQSNEIEKRFIRVNLFLIGLLFFCTLPNCIVYYIYIYNSEVGKDPKFFVARIVADNAMYVKALVDPLIFAWRLPKYRKALRKSVSRK